MGFPLLFQPPTFQCYDPQSNNFTLCTEIEACENQEKFEKNPEIFHNNDPFLIDKENSSHSLVIDFELYCGRKNLIGFCGSVFFIGALVAGYIFPKIAEKRGRKEAILLSLLLSGISICIAGLSTSIYFFSLMIFISGIGLNGFETLTLVYITEISGKKFFYIAKI